MNALTRILFYLGMGALAHWLWLGSHFDPNDVFTWVCLLLGPLMVFVWVVKLAAWWVLALFLFSVFVAGAFWFVEVVKRPRNRWRR